MKRFWIVFLMLGFVFTSGSTFAQDFQKEEKAVISEPEEPVNFDKTNMILGFWKKELRQPQHLRSPIIKKIPS